MTTYPVLHRMELDHETIISLSMGFSEGRAMAKAMLQKDLANNEKRALHENIMALTPWLDALVDDLVEDDRYTGSFDDVAHEVGFWVGWQAVEHHQWPDLKSVLIMTEQQISSEVPDESAQVLLKESLSKLLDVYDTKKKELAQLIPLDKYQEYTG